MRRLFLGFGLAAALCAAVLIYAVLAGMGRAPEAPAKDLAKLAEVPDRFVELVLEPESEEEPERSRSEAAPKDEAQAAKSEPASELSGLLGTLNGPSRAPHVQQPGYNATRTVVVEPVAAAVNKESNQNGERLAAKVADPGGIGDGLRDRGVHENLGANLVGKGPLKGVFAAGEPAVVSKSNDGDIEGSIGALGGSANGLMVGDGAGGLGLRSTGSGGGGEGFGRIHGMGKIDTGGGRGTKASLGGKKASRQSVTVRRGEVEIADMLDGDVAAAPAPIASDDDKPSLKKPALSRTIQRAQLGAEAGERDLAQNHRAALEQSRSRTQPEARRAQVAAAAAQAEREKSGADLGSRDGRNLYATPFQTTVTAEDTRFADEASRAWRTTGRFEAPGAMLPRTFYFENTYLGRNAGYLEERAELERRFGHNLAPWRLAGLPDQPIDPPESGGLALNVALSDTWIDRPQRVFLQVSLRGSERHGWRRPPLDQVVVIDSRLFGRQQNQVLEALRGLAARLGPQDQVAVILTGDTPRVLLPLGSAKALRSIEGQLPRRGSDGAPDAALAEAGRLLTEAAEGRMRVPGTGVVLWLAGPADDRAVGAASAGAHALTLQGAITSVIAVQGGRGWWPVAQAGHGNHHSGSRPDQAVANELDALSRVIARLLRINIRLGPDVEAIRVLGSRVLTDAEKAAVKAREVATDTQLSKTLGLKADRGDDDDGLQTVIPTFYGGDAHVILVELWVKKPGLVAEVSLRAKDMVTLGNATAQSSTSLGATPRADGPIQASVRHNVQGFALAEVLSLAAADAAAGRTQPAFERLHAAPIVTAADAALVRAFRQLIRQPTAGLDAVADALDLSSRQRISHPYDGSEVYR